MYVFQSICPSFLPLSITSLSPLYLYTLLLLFFFALYVVIAFHQSIRAARGVKENGCCLSIDSYF